MSANTLSVSWSATVAEQTHITGRALLFVMGNSSYGVSVDFVRQVIEMPAVVPVAGSEEWLLGMANCDGVALPLIDVRALFTAEPAPEESLQRAIIIDCAQGTMLLAVDQITTLTDLSATEKHNRTPANYAADYLEYSCESNGVTVGVLNIVRLFDAVRGNIGKRVDYPPAAQNNNGESV